MVSTKFISALALAFVAVYAGNDNAFISPGLGNVGNANSDILIKWTPSTSGAVNLILRGGDQNNLSTILTIASNIPNSGSFEWSIPSTVGSSTAYTIEIQDAADTTNVNYSPYFTILAVGQGITTSSGNIASATSSGSASAASDASSSASASGSDSASATGSSTAVSGSSTGSASGSSTGSSSGSATGSSTGSATGSSSASASSTKASSNAASAPTGGLVAFAAAGLGAAVALL